MNTSKLIGTVLIVLSIGIGYIGMNKIASSTEKFNFLGLEIDASNESGQMEGFMYLGLAVALFAGGLYSSKSKG